MRPRIGQSFRRTIVIAVATVCGLAVISSIAPATARAASTSPPPPGDPYLVTYGPLTRIGNDIRPSELEWHDLVTGTSGVLATSDTETVYGQPEVSPDGTKVVYTFTDGTSRGLAVVDARTNQVTTLYAVPEYGSTGLNYLSWPTWSPDGSTIAFGACLSLCGSTGGVYAIDAAGGGAPAMLVPGAGVPSYDGDGDLFVAPGDTSSCKLEEITSAGATLCVLSPSDVGAASGDPSGYAISVNASRGSSAVALTLFYSTSGGLTEAVGILDANAPGSFRLLPSTIAVRGGAAYTGPLLPDAPHINAAGTQIVYNRIEQTPVLGILVGQPWLLSTDPAATPAQALAQLPAYQTTGLGVYYGTAATLTQAPTPPASDPTPPPVTPTPPSTPTPAAQPSRLTAGHVLSAGHQLVSPNSVYIAVMQTDGNFVIYKTGKAIFATRTNGHPGARLAMQTDGNLVIYIGGKALWASHSHGTSASLAMQSDGNGVVYGSGRALWASKTGLVRR